MRRLSVRAVVIRLVIAAAAAAAIIAGIVTTLVRPVGGDSVDYSAQFNDVSGLRVGDDVRMYGVAVGKVAAIDLRGNSAEVVFSVQESRGVYRNTRLAIRYQNLTGQRYLDVQQPERAVGAQSPDSRIGEDRTTGSFDVTALFNGMRPVLAELSPGAVNSFMLNALAVIEGDGRAVGATLNAISEMSRYASDRNVLFSRLLGNLSAVEEQIGGRSAPLGTLIRGVSDVFVNLQKQFEGLMHFVDVAPPVLGPLNQLLEALGMTTPTNPDLLHDLNLLFPDPKTTVDTLGRLPGLLQSLIAAVPARGQPKVVTQCSKGHADVPGVFSLLVSGQKVAVCRL